MVDVEHKEHSVECATDSHVSNVSNSNNDQLDFDHCIHGVLHHLSRQQMAVLDRIEGGYIRRLCNVSLYNTPPYVDQAIPPTATRQAYVYQMDPVKLAATGKGDNLPQERYLDIVARGCQNFGMLVIDCLLS